jgi:hypothetical protein
MVTLVSSDPRLHGPLDRAIAMWRGCPQYGVGFPQVARVEGRPSPDPEDRQRAPRWIEVTISERPGRESHCGVFRGRSIVVYRRTYSADGDPRHCKGLVENLAHEIGHALGRGHTGTDEEPGGLVAPLMAAKFAGSSRRPRVVMPEDCAELDRHWTTSLELDATSRHAQAAPQAPTIGDR